MLCMGKLTTHVLDTAGGIPASGVAIRLYALANGRELRATAVTNTDGRTGEPLLAGAELVTGEYELEFEVGNYFRGRGAELDDPAFLGVRSEIADEIAALQRVEQPDLTGIALALSALSEQASGLALKGHERVAPATAPDQTNAAAGSQSGWDRFVASVQAALKGLVAVRRTDSAVEPLLPPDEVYFLYRNLELKLEVARLALLQRNQEVYRTSLRGVRSWLNTYFDTEDGSVANALNQIADLEGKQIAPTLPDISGSLQQLQQVEPGADGEADADAI